MLSNTFLELNCGIALFQTALRWKRWGFLTGKTFEVASIFMHSNCSICLHRSLHVTCSSFSFCLSFFLISLQRHGKVTSSFRRSNCSICLHRSLHITCSSFSIRLSFFLMPLYDLVFFVSLEPHFTRRCWSHITCFPVHFLFLWVNSILNIYRWSLHLHSICWVSWNTPENRHFIDDNFCGPFKYMIN